MADDGPREQAVSARAEPVRQELTGVAVVFDVDGVLRLAPLHRQLLRLRALLVGDPRDRRTLLGMPQLLRALARSAPDAPVFYLTALPDRFTRLFTRMLGRDGYPPGTPLMVGRGLVSGWLLGTGQAHKRAGLARLAERLPQVRWVLVGDDAGHDPRLFTGFTRDHPDRVAAVALRQVVGRDRSERAPASRSGGIPPVAVAEAPNGDELLPLLRAALGLDRTGPDGSREPAVEDWFLTATERGNPATRLRAWTTGNAVHPRVHGDTYFRAFADRLAATGPGDAVLFAGWSGSCEQKLTDTGPTIAEALTGAAKRGTLVRGLLWRQHLAVLGYHLDQVRRLAAAVGAAGGEVLLDQRVRPLGSHHQKFVLIRHRRRPHDDVAFVGGIDLDLGSRDDAVHRGDPQSAGSGDEYTRSPRHDAQLELRGPVVREVEDAFRERWDDPARPSRLPWHVVSDRVHRLPRTGSPLPDPAPAPPTAGGCAVQILRTYPRRRPRHPFAPLGERSVARAYIKALGRAQRLVYVEDQYLWSADVARTFAAALRRAPDLHLIAVAARPDQEGRPDPATLGQAEAFAMVREAGGDRVQVLDVENEEGESVYVHAKVCIIDDVWAAVGSNNLNTRSWTHDSELVAAVLDDERDRRAPVDPAGLGDGARLTARDLRLELMREHLGVHDDADLLDPDRAVQAVRRQVAALDAWHDGGCQGPRPPGRLRRHAPGHERVRLTLRHRWLTGPAYRMVLDPDGRPLGMRLRRAY